MKTTTCIFFACLALAVLLTPITAQAQILIECVGGEGEGGDHAYRGFYIPSYPGLTLDQVDLWIICESAGPFDLQLWAWADAYHGELLHMAEVTVALNPAVETLTHFSFPSVAVDPHSVVAFELNKVTGPGNVFYGTETTTVGCPIIQTNGTTPPLDTIRREGIRILVYGTGILQEERTTWSAVKAMYR